MEQLPKKIIYNHKETFTTKRNKYKKYKYALWEWDKVLNELHLLKRTDCHAFTVISKKYNITDRSLRNNYIKWLNNNNHLDKIENRGGDNKCFTEIQEKSLCEYIIEVFINNNLFFDDECLRIIAKKYWNLICNENEKNIFKASKGWVYDFKRKWYLSTRTANYSRTTTINELEVKNFIIECSDKCKNIPKKYIFNLDETFWRIINGNLQVIGIVNTDNRKLCINVDIKSGFTAVFLISADGKFHKPIIIVKGKTDKCLNKIGLNNDTDAYCKHSLNGWIDETILIFILNKINEYTCGNLSVLILDKYSVHTSPTIKNTAIKLNINLIYVPAGSTSTNQPLDVNINGPIKSISKKIIKEIYMSDPFATPTISDSVKTLIKSVQNVKESTIINSFAKACDIK